MGCPIRGSGKKWKEGQREIQCCRVYSLRGVKIKVKPVGGGARL